MARSSFIYPPGIRFASASAHIKFLFHNGFPIIPPRNLPNRSETLEAGFHREQRQGKRSLSPSVQDGVYYLDKPFITHQRGLPASSGAALSIPRAAMKGGKRF